MSQELKDFSNKLIEQTHDECLKSRLEDLVRKDNRFYLEGLRCLFSENGNLKWMLDYIEGTNRIKEVNLKRVKCWPKIRSFKLNEQNFNLNINYKVLLEKIQPGLISNQISNDSTKKELYSDIKQIINVKMSCIKTILSVLENLKNKPAENVPSLEFISRDEEFLYKGEQFLFPENIVEKDEFKVEFWQSYQVQKADFKFDILRNDEIDSKLARFYFDQDQIDPRTQLCEEFNKLKELFKIEINWDGYKYDRQIKSNKIEINRIRDQLARLDEIREIHNLRIKQEERNMNSVDNNLEETYQRLETFIEPENNLFSRMDEILIDNKTVCIYGIPGCGKTTLACEYALYRKSANEDLSIVFIKSGNFEDNVYELKERFVKFRDDLVKLEEILPLIESNIKKSKNKIVFIFDDVKNEVEFVEFAASIDQRHKIVITTNNSHLLGMFDEESIELGTFSREKCEQYLSKHGIDFNNKNVENFLKNEANFSPYLIELFAKQLKVNLFDLNEMKFNLDRKEQLKYIMDQMKKKDSLALDILKHLSFLDKHNIEFELIEEIFINESRNNLEKSLKFLIETGYIKQNRNECFEMSGQTQNDLVSIVACDEKSIEAKITQALTNLIIRNKNFLTIKLQFEKVKKIYYHIEKLTFKEESEFAKNYYNVRLIKKVKEIIDDSYFKIGKSIEMADKVIEIIQKYCKLKIKTCKMKTSKGKLKYKLANYNEALICFKTVLKIQKKYYFNNRNKEEIGESYNNIGMVYYSKGEYEKAITNFNKSYKILKLALPENHSSIASLYNNIGSVNKSKGEYHKAIDYYKISLEIKKEALQGNNPDIAGSYNDSKEKYNNKAFNYYKKSFEIRIKALPENLPDIDTSYDNFGTMYYSKGEYDKAIDFYNKSLKILKITLPENHPDIAKSYNNIGTAYDLKGEYDTAIHYFNKSLELRIQVLIENHPDIATSYNNIGTAYYSKGEYDKALDFYKKSLEILKNALTESHPDIATSYINIGTAYESKFEYEKALDYYNKSLEIRINSLPENHPDIATSYNNIGTAYYSKGEYDKAIDYYNKSLEIRINALPENHLGILTLYNNIRTAYYSKGDYDKAIDYYNNIKYCDIPGDSSWALDCQFLDNDQESSNFNW